jgi:hypothetical protein
MAHNCPQPKSYGTEIITDEKSYEEIKKYLYPEESLRYIKKAAAELKEMHDRGEIIIRLWLDGFFWFPRTLFGIENHMYAFYDHAELMHRINEDLADFHIRTLDKLFEVITPDMSGFAEDMSYNHGPMLSYKLFKTFVEPYYLKVVPVLKEHGVKVLVDTDGFVEDMIPWLLESGIEGVYPLERQAGVDINRIRANYPGLLMMGAYDKMVMSLFLEQYVQSQT